MASFNNSTEIDYTSYSIPLYETVTSRTIKFVLILICQLLSISCSIFLLFHLITKATLYRALHNHTIIALVIVSFFQTISDLPMSLDYLRIGQASSSIFCLMWNFFALSNYAVAVGIVPTCSISLLSLGLIVRVIRQKRRVQQRINWRQHRRMIIQLLSISCLYIFFDAPTVLIGLIRLSLPTFAMDIQIQYLFYIVYLLPLLVPFICLSTFRELWSKNRTRIHPTMPFTQSHTTRRNPQTINIKSHVVQTTKL
ncbi:unnamed protein product [Adineta steineri]|uniref:G-protein coupled receptors family 1 profile domain-containing protein n=1 Tax=Adineta steineri TaxID=433720 RepID=A0A819TEV5_9BILA|nr:unnamed protein product [Adineta steineri]